MDVRRYEDQKRKSDKRILRGVGVTLRKTLSDFDHVSQVSLRIIEHVKSYVLERRNQPSPMIMSCTNLVGQAPFSAPISFAFNKFACPDSSISMQEEEERQLDSMSSMGDVTQIAAPKSCYQIV